jgi:hypothetical protein
VQSKTFSGGYVTTLAKRLSASPDPKKGEDFALSQGALDYVIAAKNGERIDVGVILLFHWEDGK